MDTQTLEKRLNVIENELSEIKRELMSDKVQPRRASWERIFGSFAESEGFDEAVRLGREYRDAQNADAETSEA